MKKWAETWKFLTGVVGTGTEWLGMMEFDVTVAEPSRLAPGHAEFAVCHFQSLSCPDSRMVTTNGQSQREVFRKLKNILPDLVMLPSHNNIGPGTQSGCAPVGEGSGGGKTHHAGLVWVCTLFLCFLLCPPSLGFQSSSSFLHFCMWFLCCQHFPIPVTSDYFDFFNIIISVADPSGFKYLANFLLWPGWRVIYNERGELASFSVMLCK